MSIHQCVPNIFQEEECAYIGDAYQTSCDINDAYRVGFDVSDDTISIASDDEDWGEEATLWTHVYVPDQSEASTRILRLKQSSSR